MKSLIHRTFFKHPQSVDETYFQHLVFALKFSATLFVAAFAALLHALIPVACERTASKKIIQLHNRMHNR